MSGVPYPSDPPDLKQVIILFSKAKIKKICKEMYQIS